MPKRRSVAEDAYQRLAKERCAEAVRAAEEAARQKQQCRLPPGVWWGFHWFWPPELLRPTELLPMEDPEFLEKVRQLMNDQVRLRACLRAPRRPARNV